jgi:hypothetical protein
MPDRSNAYTNATLASVGAAAAGGLAYGAGRGTVSGAKQRTAENYKQRMGLRRRIKVVTTNPNLRYARNGEPDGRFKEGRDLSQARRDMVANDAERLSAKNQYKLGRKVMRGGRAVAAGGGLAALAFGVAADRSRRQKRAPQPVPDVKAKGADRARRIASLAPPGRPAGAREFEEGPNGKLQVKKTPRQEMFDSYRSAGGDNRRGRPVSRDTRHADAAAMSPAAAAWQREYDRKKREEDDGVHTPWRADS